MKKLIFVLIVTVFTSCQQKKLDRMQEVQDSLQQVAQEKDSTITDFIGSMNEIQSNLDSVKKLEDIVNIESQSNAEPTSSTRNKIMRDIAMINDLLQKNRELIASQQKKLSNSSYKMNEMQDMLDGMTRQLEAKDTEIASLSEELQKLHVNIDSLNKDLQAARERTELQAKMIEEKSDKIDRQTSELNTAYYVFGTAKELIENGVIEKKGGFLGIGRAMKFREDFNPDVFTKVDIRDLNEINLNAKKTNVITIIIFHRKFCGAFPKSRI